MRSAKDSWAMYRVCPDNITFLGESHLCRVIQEYFQFFNQARPHQGIEQKIPEETRFEGEREGERKGKIIAIPVLNGLHHAFQRIA